MPLDIGRVRMNLERIGYRDIKETRENPDVERYRVETGGKKKIDRQDLKEKRGQIHDQWRQGQGEHKREKSNEPGYSVEITCFCHEKTAPRMIVGVGVPESAILRVKLGVQNGVGPAGK